MTAQIACCFIVSVAIKWTLGFFDLMLLVYMDTIPHDVFSNRFRLLLLFSWCVFGLAYGFIYTFLSEEEREIKFGGSRWRLSDLRATYWYLNFKN